MKKYCFNLWILFYLLTVCQSGVILNATKESPVVHPIGGTHLIADFYDCTVSDDTAELEKIFRAAAKEAGATALEFTAHKFDPIGITAFLILSESHISVHSYPEYKYAAVDVFTCGTANPRKAIDYLKQAFNAKSVKTIEVKRGQN